jgi:hypothetical protein
LGEVLNLTIEREGGREGGRERDRGRQEGGRRRADRVVEDMFF